MADASKKAIDDVLDSVLKLSISAADGNNGKISDEMASFGKAMISLSQLFVDSSGGGGNTNIDKLKDAKKDLKDANQNLNKERAKSKGLTDTKSKTEAKYREVLKIFVDYYKNSMRKVHILSRYGSEIMQGGRLETLQNNRDNESLEFEALQSAINTDTSLFKTDQQFNQWIQKIKAEKANLDKNAKVKKNKYRLVPAPGTPAVPAPGTTPDTPAGNTTIDLTAGTPADTPAGSSSVLGVTRKIDELSDAESGNFAKYTRTEEDEEEKKEEDVDNNATTSKFRSLPFI